MRSKFAKDSIRILHLFICIYCWVIAIGWVLEFLIVMGQSGTPHFDSLIPVGMLYVLTLAASRFEDFCDSVETE